MAFRIALTSVAIRPISSRVGSGISGVTGVTRTVRSPSAIAWSPARRSAAQCSRSIRRRSSTGATPRVIDRAIAHARAIAAINATSTVAITSVVVSDAASRAWEFACVAAAVSVVRMRAMLAAMRL